MILNWRPALLAEPLASRVSGWMSGRPSLVAAACKMAGASAVATKRLFHIVSVRFPCTPHTEAAVKVAHIYQIATGMKE
jgi:hypothetical protein